MRLQTGRAPTVDQVRVRVLPDGRMTRRDAATYVGVAEKTLAMWAMEGKGPPVHRVGGRCFYYVDQLNAFIRGKPARASDRGSDKNKEA